MKPRKLNQRQIIKAHKEHIHFWTQRFEEAVENKKTDYDNYVDKKRDLLNYMYEINGLPLLGDEEDEEYLEK